MAEILYAVQLVSEAGCLFSQKEGLFMSRTTQETTMFKPVSKTETVSRTIHEVVEALQEKVIIPLTNWLATS